MKNAKQKTGALRPKPVQQRSRKRVEEIIEAAAQLMFEEGADALTTRSVAARSGIPVPTIYRYFADRDAIIIAFIEREMREIDRQVAESVLQLDHVTVRGVIEAFGYAYMHHHQRHPKAAIASFGSRQSEVVVAYVEAQDERIALRLTAAFGSVGLLRTDTPRFVAKLMVRQFDRMFEFVFTTERTAEEQQAIVDLFIDLTATYLEQQFATPAGIEGVARDDFVEALAKLIEDNRE
ncbi:MAG: TetR/AcrR family transcriptional regulator [Thermoleophilaceae bacterium]|nr:TetR/AcrR family transcriptional regulator [Thermoleophilaceae bacterium]